MKGILIDKQTDDAIVNVVRDSSGMIVSGLVVDDIDYQRVDLLITTYPGELKQHPTIGFGVMRFKNADITKKKQFVRDLTMTLQSDGFKNPEIKIGTSLMDFTVEV